MDMVAGQEHTTPSRGRKGRASIDCPEVVSETGVKTTLKFKAVPEEWDFKTHNLLKRAQFEDECVYLRWIAGVRKLQADECLAEAEELEAVGSLEARRDVAKVKRLQEEMKRLSESLISQGVDVASIMNKI